MSPSDAGIDPATLPMQPSPLQPSSLAPTQPSPVTELPAPSVAPTSIPPPSLPLGALPTLQDALVQRVRVGGGAGPLWAFALIAVALSLGGMALVSGSCSALVARSAVPDPKAVASVKPVASVEPPAPAPPPATVPPEVREAAPPKAPIAAIEQRSPRERSVADVLALGAARAAKKRRDVTDDAARASQNPLFAGSPELSQKLLAASRDPDTATEALGAMARLPSPAGPDLLWFVWTTRKKSDPSAVVAEQLLATGEVRTRASPAVLVALDLRAAETCDQAKEALGRAVEHGDRRSLSYIGRFAQKKGCGEGKREDCWPCLRDGDELKSATKAAAKRAAPRL
jgi:hypothetical protein